MRGEFFEIGGMDGERMGSRMGPRLSECEGGQV